jgi:hypothetical protein
VSLDGLLGEFILSRGQVGFDAADHPAAAAIVNQKAELERCQGQHCGHRHHSHYTPHRWKNRRDG